jgi:hypothetical protein
VTAWLRRLSSNKWITLACLTTAFVVALAVWAHWSAENLAQLGCFDVGDDNFPETKCKGPLGRPLELLLTFGLAWAWVIAFTIPFIAHWVSAWHTLTAVSVLVIALLWLFGIGAGVHTWIIKPVSKLFRTSNDGRFPL